jgi:hypothetical protein
MAKELFEECPRCGLKYDDMRTGLTFGDVFQMLWVPDDDSEKWRYKRKGTVLGFWRMLKLDMWREHLAMCRPDLEIPEVGEGFGYDERLPRSGEDGAL